MLRKLMKYEWKNNAGILGILSLAALGISLLGAVALRVLVSYGDDISNAGGAATLAFVPLGLLVFIAFIALALYVAAVNILQLYRFYKNKFTDEGYLTFTLPVRPSQIFLSSGIMMLLWQFLSGLLAIVLLILIIVIGTAQSEMFGSEFWEFLRDLPADFSDIFLDFGQEIGTGYSVMTILSLIITPIYAVVINMTWITLGAVLAKKHKILAAIGLAYGGNMVIGILNSIITTFPTILALSSHGDMLQQHYLLSSALQLALYVALAIGGYFLSTGLMKHKLNLP